MVGYYLIGFRIRNMLSGLFQGITWEYLLVFSDDREIQQIKKRVYIFCLNGSI